MDDVSASCLRRNAWVCWEYVTTRQDLILAALLVSLFSLWAASPGNALTEYGDVQQLLGFLTDVLPAELQASDMPGRRNRDHTIVCGHWSELGLKMRPDLISLDSGCVWGRRLTAVRLGDREVFQVPCPPQRRAA